jgi:hypothetical protein
MAKKLIDTKKYSEIKIATDKGYTYITSAFVFIAKFKGELESLGYAVEYFPAEKSGLYRQPACYNSYRPKK